MDSVPPQVFSQAERLRELGLAAPKASMIAARLRALGIPVKQGVYTVEQLRLALRELRAHEISKCESNASEQCSPLHNLGVERGNGSA